MEINKFNEDDFKNNNMLHAIYSYFTEVDEFMSIVSSCELSDYLHLLNNLDYKNPSSFDYDYLKEKRKTNNITLVTIPLLYCKLDEYAFHKFIKFQKDHLQYDWVNNFDKEVIKYYLDIFIKYKELLDKLKEEEENK